MTPGFVYDMPEADYHASPGVSASMLKKLRRSPAHLRAYLAGRKEGTDSLAFGSLAHIALLQPERLQTDYVIAPHDAPPKTSRKWWADYRASQSGKEILAREDLLEIQSLRQSVLEHPVAKKILLAEGGRAEVSAFVRDPLTGLDLRCRFDWIRIPDKSGKGGICADVKTCQDARPGAFSRDVWKFGYHLQDAFYLYVLKLLKVTIGNFAFIAVEKEAPFAVQVYELDEEARKKGAEEVGALLTKYAECVMSGEWPSYEPKALSLSLPKWAGKDDIGEVLFEGSDS